MPWNETTRKQYSRKTERYESDPTDAEWTLPDPLLPPSYRLGRPRHVDLREVVNAIAYILWTGCSWRALPKDFPAFTTVQTYFYAWSRSGVLEQVCARFTTLERLRSGRSADPSAANIDSRSVPTVEAGSDECGDDAGNTLAAQVHPAHIQDRDGARPLLLALQAGQNTVQTVFADGACGGNKLASALKEANCPITVEVIGKPRDTKGGRRHVPALGGRTQLRMAAPLPAPLQGLRAIHRQRPRLAPAGSEPCSHAPPRTHASHCH